MYIVCKAKHFGSLDFEKYFSITRAPGMGKAPCTMLLHRLHLGQFFLTKPGPHVHKLPQKEYAVSGFWALFYHIKKPKKKKKKPKLRLFRKIQAWPHDPFWWSTEKKYLGSCRNFKKSMNLKMTETLCFMSYKLHEHLKAWETDWFALLGLYYSIQRSPCCLLVFTWNLTKGLMNVMG